MFDQTGDCQTEEDDVRHLQDQNDGVEVDELRREEEVRPGARAGHPLGVPGLAQETVGVRHAGQGEAPVTVSELVHQVGGDHEDQGTALDRGNTDRGWIFFQEIIIFPQKTYPSLLVVEQK